MTRSRIASENMKGKKVRPYNVRRSLLRSNPSFPGGANRPRKNRAATPESVIKPTMENIGVEASNTVYNVGTWSKTQEVF